MPARFLRGRGSGLARLSGAHWAKQRRTTLTLESHGVWLYTGPKGAGKSLLAHAHCYMLANGVFRDREGRCICRDPSCDGKWKVFTMHESPTLPEYGAWAYPLDLGELLDIGEVEKHIVVYIDEITQYLNSRRGMVSEVIKLLNRVTFTRKSKIIFIGTGISIDWIDVRLRDQATQIFNCWTPNRGQSVWANVHRLALGHLPPHLRRLPPETRWWPTAWTHRKNGGLGIYNTDELVDAAADFAAAKTEPVFYTQQGEIWEQKTHTEAVAEAIEDILMAGTTTVTPEMIVNHIKGKYSNIPITIHWVKDWLLTTGFQRGEGSDFVIGTAMLQGEETPQ